jgi:hypothetical protein
VPKILTQEQAESRKQRAVRFVRDVLGDPNRADEIEDESLESYAERRGFRIVNPVSRGRTTVMASNKTKKEIEAEIGDLQEELDTVYSKLDDIAGIASGEEDEDDDSDDDSEEEELDNDDD